MVIQEINSRLFYIKGEGRLDISHGDDHTCSRVEKGRCLYMVRLEIALEEHSEIKDDKFDLTVITTKSGLFYSKGVGRSRRGIVGEVVLFERLVEESVFPDMRSDKAVDPMIKEALTDLLSWYHYNCRVNIYSEFSGYWDGFVPHFY